MPIRSMPKTPVLDLFYQTAETPEISNLTNEDLADIQKEQENRLLGTMGMQSIFLMLAIMLYETWEWSQFEIIWQYCIIFGQKINSLHFLVRQCLNINFLYCST